MFQFFKDRNLYLYHYTKSATAINCILKTEKLKFSTYSNTNDPKESKDWFFIPGTCQGKELSKYSPKFLGNLMNPRIKSTARLACFSKDRELSGNHMEDLPKRGFCKPRMWAQYADNHKGICLVFHAKLLTDMLTDMVRRELPNNMWWGGEVTYRDRLIAEIQDDPAYVVNVDCLEDWGEAEYVYSHALQFFHRLFFEKATDWENENEYRFVVLEVSQELLLPYGNALSGIVFGNDCSENDIAKIVSLTRGKSLSYQQLKWRNCTPWFDFGRMRWV